MQDLKVFVLNKTYNKIYVCVCVCVCVCECDRQEGETDRRTLTDILHFFHNKIYIYYRKDSLKKNLSYKLVHLEHTRKTF